jgi:hypothetical protein
MWFPKAMKGPLNLSEGSLVSGVIRKLESAIAPIIGLACRGSVDTHRISQAGFMSLCDAVYPPQLKALSPKKRDVNLADARVVYVQSDHFEKFVSTYPDSKARVLLIGNSDRDWENFSSPSFSNLKHCFVQNLVQAPSEGISALPIGIENRAHGRNGMPWNFNQAILKRPKKLGIFFGPMGNTHPTRAELGSVDLTQIHNIQRISERMSAIEFSWKSSEWSHVLAPRGNGIDTHRFWEALYRGSVPIVVKSNWTTSMRQLGITLIEVESWSLEELTRVSSNLKVCYPQPHSAVALTLEYWRDRISEFQ